MGARAMWKAVLVIGTERLAVKLYAAVEDRAVRFHLLHAKDGARVRQRMAHPKTGKTVEREEMLRGVEVERGRFVVLDDEELAELEPEPSRDIVVERFVPTEAIEARWYARPYYLGPDEGEDERYAALVEALRGSEREGLARWTMRKRFYTGALRLHEERLALVALRSAQELLPLSSLEPPTGRALADRETKLARQLVAALTDDFDPSEFRDDYRDRVLELVHAKRKGERIELERFVPEEAGEEDLADRLRASLQEAR